MTTIHSPDTYAFTPIGLTSHDFHLQGGCRLPTPCSGGVQVDVRLWGDCGSAKEVPFRKLNESSMHFDFFGGLFC